MFSFLLALLIGVRSVLSYDSVALTVISRKFARFTGNHRPGLQVVPVPERLRVLREITGSEHGRRKTSSRSMASPQLTKGCGSRQATLTMVYKLAREAEKRWRRLNGHHFIVKVLRGVRFVDGEAQADDRLAA